MEKLERFQPGARRRVCSRTWMRPRCPRPRSRGEASDRSGARGRHQFAWSCFFPASGGPNDYPNDDGAKGHFEENVPQPRFQAQSCCANAEGPAYFRARSQVSTTRLMEAPRQSGKLPLMVGANLEGLANATAALVAHAQVGWGETYCRATC